MTGFGAKTHRVSDAVSTRLILCHGAEQQC
jgi:hypothetical protein